MNSKNHNCLIISDGTEGMENQSMALAKSLGFKSNLLKAKPFWLCRLFPTFLAGRFKIPLSNNDSIFKTKNYTIYLTSLFLETHQSDQHILCHLDQYLSVCFFSYYHMKKR